MGIRSNMVNRLMNIRLVSTPNRIAGKATGPARTGKKFKDIMGNESFIEDFPEKGLIPQPGYEFLKKLNYGNIRAFLYQVEKLTGEPYHKVAGSGDRNKIPGKGLERLEKAGLISWHGDGDDRTLHMTDFGKKVYDLSKRDITYHLPLGVHPRQTASVTEKDMYKDYFLKGKLDDGTVVTTNYGTDSNGNLRSYSQGISAPKDDFIVEFQDVPAQKSYGKKVSDISGNASIYESKSRQLSEYQLKNYRNTVRDGSGMELQPVAYGHHLFGGLYCLEGKNSAGEKFYVELADKTVNYFMEKYGPETKMVVTTFNTWNSKPGSPVMFVKDGKILGMVLKSYQPKKPPDLRKLYVPNRSLIKWLKEKKELEERNPN